MFFTRSFGGVPQMLFNHRHHFVKMVSLLSSIIHGDRGDDPSVMLTHDLMTPADGWHHLLSGSLHGRGHRA
jgi:hypothetical protein